MDPRKEFNDYLENNETLRTLMATCYYSLQGTDLEEKEKTLQVFMSVIKILYNSLDILKGMYELSKEERSRLQDTLKKMYTTTSVN